MKILFLPKYYSDGASSRYRTFQYIPFFQKNEINCHISSFYQKGYVKNLYDKKWLNLLLYPFCILRRLWVIIFSWKYDLVVIEKEAIPYFPPIAEKGMSIMGKKFILDYDDAIYFNYILSSNKLIRRLFSNKIPSILKIANGVITGSPELTTYVEQFNKRVAEIPTSIDIDKYTLKKGLVDDSKFVIGWIGSISTSKYIDDIKGGLIKFLEKVDNAELHLIGYKGDIKHPSIKIIPWSAETEVYELNSINIGIMPLRDTPFEHGKCGFKLIQYMACEKPTISTPFQANTKIDGGIGNLFATTADEWYDCLLYAYNNAISLKQIGIDNRQRVESEYCIQSNVDMYIKFYDFVNSN